MKFTLKTLLSTILLAALIAVYVSNKYQQQNLHTELQNLKAQSKSFAYSTLEPYEYDIQYTEKLIEQETQKIQLLEAAESSFVKSNLNSVQLATPLDANITSVISIPTLNPICEYEWSVFVPEGQAVYLQFLPSESILQNQSDSTRKTVFNKSKKLVFSQKLPSGVSRLKLEAQHDWVHSRNEPRKLSFLHNSKPVHWFTHLIDLDRISNELPIESQSHFAKPDPLPTLLTIPGPVEMELKLSRDNVDLKMELGGND